MRVPSFRLVGKVGAAVGTQAIPFGGVLGGWSPATGLVLYWIEAVVGVLLAVAAIELYRRRILDPRLDAALGPPGSAAAQAARDGRIRDLESARVRPREILLIYGGSFVIFGLFFAGILFILSEGHDVVLPSMADLRRGAPPLVGFALLGFLFDLPGLGRRPASFVAARVEALTARWAMLWAVGFFGTMIMVFWGHPGGVFLVFAGLKTLYEIGVALERLTGRHPGAAGVQGA